MPEALVEAAAETGQHVLGLTDRDGIYGAVPFMLACQSAGVDPVVGVDLAIEPLGEHPHLATAAHSSRRTPARGGRRTDARLPRVVLLAHGRQGWSSLCRLITHAHLRGGERGLPVTTVQSVVAHSAAGGLVTLLGPDSELGWALARRHTELARRVVASWSGFGVKPDLAVELVSHFARHDSEGPALYRSSALARRMAGFAAELKIPSVLTNAVRHARPEQSRTVDILDASRRLVPLSRRNVDRVNSQGYVKSGLEMLAVADEIMGDRSEALDLIRRTNALAERCALDPVVEGGLGDIHVPELDVVLAGTAPAPLDTRMDLESGSWAEVVDAVTSFDLRRRDPRSIEQEQLVAQRELEDRCWRSYRQRLDRGSNKNEARQAEDRLRNELRTIETMGFAGYFLTVAEVVNMIRSDGVRVAARGSGAGSYVNFLLGISGVDPLEHGLLMERFLSPLRRALPDIDIDVESHRRTDMYERILERFGGERISCVSMMDTYRVRHAIRDVGAALGMPPMELDGLAKAFPHIRARDARSALQGLPEMKKLPFMRRSQTEFEEFFSLVESLDGLPRSIAMHPCGIVLSDRTMLDRTPVQASWQGFPMSQFDKDAVEQVGFLKLDVLGIRMQSAISHATAEISRGTGRLIDVDAISHDDPDAFELIRSTRTLGCFQIESPGQRELLGKFGPTEFNDLIIDISLFRPGPVKSDMVRPFLNARHGWREPDYLHPDLQPVLEETGGVVVFHEQVLRIVSILSGCSLAQADEVRRNLASIDGQLSIKAWFVPAALERGYDLAVVEKVWQVLESFASFGFCKAHAAAFALPTYQSAWLKAHYPAEFLAGVLTHDPGMYPKRLILDELRNSGVSVLGLDVNRSGECYSVERFGANGPVETIEPGRVPIGEAGVRIPLGEVKGITEAEVRAIVDGQPYLDLVDFWNRVSINRAVLERLVIAGAFDAIENLADTRRGLGSGASANRRDLLLAVADLDRAGRSAARIGRSRRSTSSGPTDTVSASRRQSKKPQPAKESDLQLSLDLPHGRGDGIGSGLPDMSLGEQVRAEFDVLGLDASSHIVSFYEEFLAALGVVRSRDLLTSRSRRSILVGGVKVATQTPPIRGGRRVVFLTLDDSTGPIDASFFEDAQLDYAHTLFHSWLLLVRGEVRRTGERGVSLRATGCWDLPSLHSLWKEHGMESVWQAMLDPGGTVGNEPGRESSTSSVSESGAKPSSVRGILAAARRPGTPFADVRPAGIEGPPGKLWHSSPGSSGW